jgi:DNA polymerase-4
MSPLRKIIHIDMDAFYASIEQRDFPQYRGKPLAVGGSRERGVVAAASYEARKFGVYSAMPSVTAHRKCPDIIFVKPRFEVYQSVSAEIMEIFRNYTDLVEPLSLDEAYLDVTDNKFNQVSATIIAGEIKEKIKGQTGLTASAGVSFNKFLAKIASDIDKPNGLKVITPDMADDFIKKLPVQKFHGVGRVTAEKMNKMGIFTGADLKKLDKAELLRNFGKAGHYYFNIVRAEDERPVVSDRVRKSIGAETTFARDTGDETVMLEQIKMLSEEVNERLIRKNVLGRTVTLKIKYHDFLLQTRSKTSHNYIKTGEELFTIVKELLRTPELPVKPVRLLGVSLSNLNTEAKAEGPYQLSFDFM